MRFICVLLNGQDQLRSVFFGSIRGFQLLKSTVNGGYAIEAIVCKQVALGQASLAVQTPQATVQ